MSGRLSGPLLSGLLLLLPLIWSRNPSVSRDEGPQQVDGDGENNFIGHPPGSKGGRNNINKDVPPEILREMMNKSD